MINDKDFKRVLTILMDVWDKAGEKASAQGLQGQAVTRVQENTMTEFMAHINQLRKGN
jgi:hypothetical protein